MTNVPGANIRYDTHPATGCLHCPALITERHHIVWGSGPTPADVMLVGEAPGYNEDMTGIPFVGKSGKDLDDLLFEAGFQRQDVHVANVLMCRPPGNRDPEPSEVENCSPWLWEHMRQVNPKVIVCFGKFSLHQFFEEKLVKDAEGLMLRRLCFTCGGMDGKHEQRHAAMGLWHGSSYGNSPEAILARTTSVPHSDNKVLVAAIYHPASAIESRNPENRGKILHQLQRVRAWIDDHAEEEV